MSSTGPPALCVLALQGYDLSRGSRVPPVWGRDVSDRKVASLPCEDVTSQTGAAPV